jgi:hypothetical protein
VLLACAAILSLAAYLSPDRRGYGTHQQLRVAGARLGPCGMLLTTGFPCPACGMTTAFAHTVRLQWAQAFWAQPAGFVLALGTVAACVTASWTLLTGRTVRLPWWDVTPFWLIVIVLVILLGGWLCKIALGLWSQALPVRWVDM